jgi:N-acetylmuramoyl-L-alanine amidase
VGWTAALISAALLCGAAPGVGGAGGARRVYAVRHWVLGDGVRISVEVSGEFHFRRGSLQSPERLYFDIVGAKPAAGSPKIQTIPVNSNLVRQIRISETQPAITRVVLDLTQPVEYSAAQLANPDRLVVEIRPAAAKPSGAGRRDGQQTAKPPPEPAASAPEPAAAPPTRLAAAGVKVEAPSAVPSSSSRPDNAVAAWSSSASPSAPSSLTFTPAPEESKPPASTVPPAAAAQSPAAAARPPSAGPAAPSSKPEPAPMVSVPAARGRAGNNSLVRALGLKLQRVVIDPGHGGHDTGTIGPNGLMEKDLVLAVARRLGALIEERLGAEVFYTRTEDVFVALEDRTALANEKRADLFLSIHGNAGVRTAAGSETYYLNFTTSKNAMEVAARENASSKRSIHELQSLIEKIALKDKVDESREFAARVQSALVKELARANPASRDRGVRKAPFIVLIGASMPSVLTEVAFLSNPREEKLLAKDDYRQKIAEGLYKGVSQYAATLSRFQLAETMP